MPLFLIERNFAAELMIDDAAATHVKKINDEIGIQWLYSFLSNDKRKTYCLYEAPNADAIRLAAQRLGVPDDAVIEVSDVALSVASGGSARRCAGHSSAGPTKRRRCQAFLQASIARVAVQATTPRHRRSA